MKKSIAVPILILALAAGAAAQTPPNEKSIAKAKVAPPSPDISTFQKVGSGLLDQFLDGVRELAATAPGTRGILEPRLSAMMSAAIRSRDENAIDYRFFDRYNKLLAVTRLIILPDDDRILGPIVDESIWQFIRDKTGDISAFHEDWIKGGPKAVNLVAKALAAELIDLQLYLDTLPRRAELQRKIEERMSGPAKGPAGSADDRPEPSAAPAAAPQGLRLHEELLLIALRDRQGTVASAATAKYALGAAILAELLLDKRVEIREEGKAEYVRLLDATPPGDSLLDDALARIAAAREPARLRTWIERFAGLKDLRARAAAGLVDRGVLRVERDKVAGLFDRTVYPQVDPRPERELTARLEAAVFGDEARVEPRTVLLVSLARNANLLPLVLDKGRLKDRKVRLERIQNGDLIGPAERQAVHAMQAARAFTAIAASTVVVSSGAHR